MRLEKFVREIFLPAIRTRKRSWQTDERIIKRHILPFFGKMALADISGPEVERWQGGLAHKGLSPSSSNRMLSVLRNIFAYGHEYGHSGTVIKSVRALPVRKKITRFLNEGEAALLWAELQKFGHKAALALRLILLTGCRKNEILKARWEHVNMENSYLVVPLSKNGQPRYVPLCNDAKKILANMRKNAASPWLFPGRNKTRPISDIYYFWNKLRSSLNLRGVRIHDLRHTFASLLLATGHSLYEAQTILGHADSRSTSIYAHLGNAELVRACGDVAARLTMAHSQPVEKEKKIMTPSFESVVESLLDRALAELKQKMLGELLQLGGNYNANFNVDEKYISDINYLKLLDKNPQIFGEH